MKTKNILKAMMLFVVILTACEKDDIAIDTEYPVIDISSADAFPKQCSEIVRGQKFTFKATFSDNAQLGSYSLDIHHNFDQHTHSTEVMTCTLDAKKATIKPFLLIKTYNIPEGQTSYSATIELDVPLDVDPGDYHFMIRLTDAEGWQTLKGLSIKIK